MNSIPQQAPGSLSFPREHIDGYHQHLTNHQQQWPSVTPPSLQTLIRDAHGNILPPMNMPPPAFPPHMGPMVGGMPPRPPAPPPPGFIPSPPVPQTRILQTAAGRNLVNRGTHITEGRQSRIGGWTDFLNSGGVFKLN